MRVTALVEEFLPLTHHAEPAIVDQQDLHGQLMAAHRREFGHRHLEAAVTTDRDDRALGVGELRADRGRQPEAHRTEPRGREEIARMNRALALRGPHLMLADVGRHDRVVGRDGKERVEHVGRGKLAVRRAIGGQRATECLGLRGPTAESRHRLFAPEPAHEALERLTQIAAQRDRNRQDLPEFRRVDVGVHDLCVARELVGLAGNAIVEPHPECEHEVGGIDGEVRGFPAVHTEHPEEARVARGRAAEPVDRRGVRQLEHRHELAIEVDGVRAARAAANDRDRSLGIADQLDRLVDRAVAGVFRRGSNRTSGERIHFWTGGFENIRGDVHEHRTRTRPARNPEGGAQHAFEVAHVAHADAALGHRTHDRGHIGLLETIGAH